MNHRLTKALVLAVAALVPATALAGPPPDPEYGGKIDGKPNRYIGFDVAGQGNDRKLRNMFAVNVPFHGCDDPGDDGKQSGEFDGKFPVNGEGEFRGTRTDKFNARGVATGITYTLEGELDSGDAEGTLRMKILGTNCRSGEVEWKARKPSPPVPDADL